MFRITPINMATTGKKNDAIKKMKFAMESAIMRD